MFLDSKLDFEEHMQNNLNKLCKNLTTTSINNNPKRYHLDYGDIIYDQRFLLSKIGVCSVQLHISKTEDGIGNFVAL